MAVSQIDLSPPSGAKQYHNTDLDGTASAVKASAATLYAIIIDNTANSAVEYVKLYDIASGSATVGTLAPDWIFKIAAAVKKTICIPEGMAFATALTAACVTTAGTAGTTNPTADVVVDVVYA